MTCAHPNFAMPDDFTRCVIMIDQGEFGKMEAEGWAFGSFHVRNIGLPIYGHLWAVTHIPSGRRLPYAFGCEDACTVARRVSALRLDWDRIDACAIPADTRAAIVGICETSCRSVIVREALA